MLHRPRRPADRTTPRCEQLEARDVPAVLIGLTEGVTQSLVRFDSATPGTLIGNPVPITGLAAGDALIGIDLRPGDNRLYGVGLSSRVYVINEDGSSAQIGAPFTPPLAGTSFGIDFNPAADKLRVVSNGGQNLRLNVNTPGNSVAATLDAFLAYDPAAFNAGNEGAPVTPPAPNVVATAYTARQPGAAAGTFVTTQYVIDSNLDILATQGQADGVAADGTPAGSGSPNSGVLFPIAGGRLGFDADDTTTFEIVGGSDMAFATRVAAGGTELYSINLTTGQGTLIGVVAGSTLRGLAAAPIAAGAGTLSLPAAATFPTDRSAIAVTVTRTDGATGAVTVNFATADGAGPNAAIAGVDFAPTSGTLAFAEGQTSQVIFLVLPAGPPLPSQAKTFTLNLSSPNGAALGGATTTVTIPAVAITPPAGNLAGPNPALVDAPVAADPADPTVTPATPSTRFLATGAGVGGGPVVNVYDAFTGSPQFNFNAFEETFRGGVTVATGDVNGDGIDDIIVGTGFGGGPRVFIFDGVTKATIANFFAYEETFRGGVNVAVGDVNGDGILDVIVGSGVGGGPRVRVFDGTTLTPTGTPTVLADFFAYEESFRGGVNVAAGVLGSNEYFNIIAGSGVGGGPRVRMFDGRSLAAVADFAVGDDALRVGVNVAAGDIDGDGALDIITGFGSGSDRIGIYTPAGALTTEFAAFGGQANGARVAVSDLLANGKDDILAGSGSGGTAQVRAFQFTTPAGGTPTASQLTAIQAFPEGFTGGVFVG